MPHDLPGYDDDLRAWRHHIHSHPELSWQEHGTAAFVEEKLRSFGIEDVVTGIGGTGIVATIRRGSSPRAIGLRADMDALPLTEQPGRAHGSRTPGVMHACGHDGHTTMLLGAARYLAQEADFDGTVHLIFQPAEESFGPETQPGEKPGGANAMIRDGLFDRFPMDAIFGMHNRPGLAAGKLGGRAGPLYAAADIFEIVVRGKGVHAARPHLGIDPVFVGAQIVVALQGVVARMTNPLDCGVVSICQFNAGTAPNIIPDQATMVGTVRTIEPDVQDKIERSIHEVATGVAAAFGAVAEVRYIRGHPSLHNEPAAFRAAREAAIAVVGEAQFADVDEPTMGGEDFSWFLREKPGCFMLIGNGDGDSRGATMLHNNGYDFNDDVATIGVRYWVSLVEHLLRPGG
ncbi:M20 aminoacylase family protein [Sphingomonas oryzagri]|jgi:hippurate hydrolase|uniref:M20 aminoacylase family protein n=1 Tax=Sphingomonas oryzagri TaxID=3042314 RepID=A0ABT6MXX2_9SPHN|nr:M20 aminoacylase family protein [Sphingomonas oryzagri]MDH7637631.1 M20 aminoacylase family protein [Sphingomonas oryzagri]